MPDTAAPPTLSLEIEHCPDSVVVRCHGKLIAGATDVLLNGVRPLIPHNKRIVLDLSDLRHTDSTGLGAVPAQQLQKALGPHRVEPVVFTLQSKETLATGMYEAFAKKRVRILDDAAMRRDNSGAPSSFAADAAVAEAHAEAVALAARCVF